MEHNKVFFGVSLKVLSKFLQEVQILQIDDENATKFFLVTDSFITKSMHLPQLSESLAQLNESMAQLNESMAQLNESKI